MPKRMRKGMKPLIRNLVRQGVREGKTRTEIFERVEDKYGVGATRTVLDMVRQEERRQANVDRLMGTSLQSPTRMGRLMNCEGEGKELRAYVTIAWEDPLTGLPYNKGMSVMLDRRMNVENALQKAINQTRDFFISKRYDVPGIDPSMRSGDNYFRLEYVECV